MVKELFVYAETKSKFLAQKLVGKIDDSQIGIIAETGEFWFQDTFYPLIVVAKVAFSGSYLDLEDKPTIPPAITENTVSGWGFTKNNGTITEVKMNGKSKGTSGVVDLGTVLTEHQDISGKVDKVQGKGLSTNDFTTQLKSKLESLENYDDTKLQETLKALRQEVTLIVSKNTTDSIESFEEIIEFLRGFNDEENLHDIVSLKMDKPSQTAMLGRPNKVMTWNGSSAMMSLPIAAGLNDWGKTDSPYGYLVTDQQVQAKIDSMANKSEVVDFANDLTGVLEATAEEFTFRPSAGDKSIRDESAVIRKIKGNTIVARYADNTSEVLPMRTIGIETIGFNAYNGEYAEVIGGQAYYLGGTINTAYFATVKGGDRVEITADSDGLYTPPANGYIYATGNDICINLSHSGVRNGEYEPYKRNIRLLPEIRKYFPNGMNGNANVWDEINTEKAIKRWEVVNLGTLTWSSQGTNTSGEYRWQASGISTPPTATTSAIPNIVCAKYTTGSNDDTYARRDCVAISASGNIRIFDSQYKEASSKEAFVASLQGVLLYYELAEPEYTDITEPMQLDYEVEDFGTEKALSLASSAPFRADIVYQFNAEGRIRDNSRNIERIENTITTRLIPSSTAMLGRPNKVMTWNGSSAMMSLPIAAGLDDWGKTDGTTYGYLVTDQQVLDYINIIKGSLSSGLMPKETIELLPAWEYHIASNKVYEMATHPNIDYTIDLKLRTDTGVDVTSDNEWRVRIDARNGFSTCALTITPYTNGYTLRWAHSDVSGPLTAPNITASYIWDIQFRMIGKTLLGSYKKY